MAIGYANVFEYEGGKQDWMDAGYPTESGCKEVAAGSLFGRLLSVVPGEVSELAEGARLEIA
jgi:3-mercaptopyruvate sulfurtransferase SseA